MLDVYIYSTNVAEFVLVMYNLQNMYEEGDDEMKRTIAKAWTDARSGKAADPLQGYR